MLVEQIHAEELEQGLSRQPGSPVLSVLHALAGSLAVVACDQYGHCVFKALVSQCSQEERLEILAELALTVGSWTLLGR